MSNYNIPVSDKSLSDVIKIKKMTNETLDIEEIVCKEMQNGLEKYIDQFRNKKGNIELREGRMIPSKYTIDKFKEKYKDVLKKEDFKEAVDSYIKENSRPVVVIDDCIMMGSAYYKVFMLEDRTFIKAPKENIVIECEF